MKISITYKDALEAYNESRKNYHREVTKEEFWSVLINLLFNDLENLDVDRVREYNDKIYAIQKQIERGIEKQRNKIPWDPLFLEVCLSSEDFINSESKKRKKIPLDDISSTRQEYRRLDPVISMINEIADEENTTPAYLLGRALHQIYYHTDKRIAHIAKILMDDTSTSKMPFDAASHIKNYNNLGREGYQREIRALKESGYDILPSWKALWAYKISITPTTHPIEGGLGVEFLYQDALIKTTESLFESMETLPDEENLTLYLKDGLDGSGSHSIFNQDG